MRIRRSHILYLVVTVVSGALSVPLPEPKTSNSLQTTTPLSADTSDIKKNVSNPRVSRSEEDECCGLVPMPTSQPVKRGCCCCGCCCAEEQQQEPSDHKSKLNKRECCGCCLNDDNDGQSDGNVKGKLSKREIQEQTTQVNNGSDKKPVKRCCGCCGAEDDDEYQAGAVRNPPQQPNSPEAGKDKVKRGASGCCGLTGLELEGCCGSSASNETECCGKQRLVRSDSDKGAPPKNQNMSRQGVSQPQADSTSIQSPKEKEKVKRGGSGCCGLTGLELEGCCGASASNETECCGKQRLIRSDPDKGAPPKNQNMSSQGESKPKAVSTPTPIPKVLPKRASLCWGLNSEDNVPEIPSKPESKDPVKQKRGSNSTENDHSQMKMCSRTTSGPPSAL